MNKLLLLVAFSACVLMSPAQQVDLSYEANAAYPYGQPHPDYADVLADYAPLIGLCACKSVNRNPDQSWADSVDMLWKFKYIMNGKAIQDETWKADGGNSGSIRQFIADSNAWAVTYFSTVAPSSRPGVWMGGASGDDMVLLMPQKAPNGFDGFSRLTFYDISDEGYKWIGEWTDKDDGTETVVYPFWSIHCRKINP